MTKKTKIKKTNIVKINEKARQLKLKQRDRMRYNGNNHKDFEKMKQALIDNKKHKKQHLWQDFLIDNINKELSKINKDKNNKILDEILKRNKETNKKDKKIKKIKLSKNLKVNVS